MNWSEFFEYDAEAGQLTWKVKRPGPRAVAGEEAGNVRADGRYRTVVLKRQRFYVHRIAWEMVHGPIQADLCIDHIDGNGLNNQLANLRLVTRSGNQRNRRVASNCPSGVPGVLPRKRGFEVRCAGKYVGYFRDFDAAVAARKAAEKTHGYHPNHGRKS